MISHIDLTCATCGRKDHHALPPFEIPPGRAVVPVTTRCACGEVFRWRVVCEGGKVRLVEVDDG